MSRFLIACGGTGGHLAPGIALAEELDRRGHRALLVISNKKVDARLVKAYPHLEYATIAGQGLSLHPLRFPGFLWQSLKGLFQSWKLIGRERPDAVVAFGGWIAQALVPVAAMRDTTVVLHEANRKPGKATKVFRRLASRLYLPPGLRLRGVAPALIRNPGYPVRKEVRRLGREEARHRLGLQGGGKWLMILGGSQGAQVLNDWVVEHFERLGSEGINVYCITGMGKGVQGSLKTRAADGTTAVAHFVPFSDAMGAVLSAADLVIARAGAGTLAELARCRAPAILVPYPYAADQHQLANARFMEQQAGAVVLNQSALPDLLAEVEDLIFNDWLLKAFRRNLACIDNPSVVREIADDLDYMLRVAAEPESAVDTQRHKRSDVSAIAS